MAVRIVSHVVRFNAQESEIIRDSKGRQFDEYHIGTIICTDGEGTISTYGIHGFDSPITRISSFNAGGKTEKYSYVRPVREGGRYRIKDTRSDDDDAMGYGSYTVIPAIDTGDE